MFDQDSVIEQDFVSLLKGSFNNAKSLNKNLIAVGPRPFDIFTNKLMKPKIEKEIYTNTNLTFCNQIIASGKMIDASLLAQVGLFESELFIDSVDHEWCWRAKSKGFDIAINEHVVMKHQLGDARGSFLGLQYKIGSPNRLYYQFRNILILARRGYVPTYWKFRNLLAMPLKFIIFSIKGPERRKRIKFMLKGLYDGVLIKKP